MTKSKVKRKLLALFLNVGTEANPQYRLMGDGIQSQTVNYNPQTEEITYVHEDAGSTEVESYRPTIPTPQTAIAGDPVFDFVDTLRRNRAVLDDAKSNLVMVYLYDTPTGTAYPAERCACSIQIDDLGGEGGKTLEINYTVNLVGEPVKGTFDPTNKTFTPDSGAEYLLTFAVTGTASARLAGAAVTVNNQELQTDANGFVGLLLPAGSYSYTVKASGYTDATGSVTISTAAALEAVTMTTSA